MLLKCRFLGTKQTQGISVSGWGSGICVFDPLLGILTLSEVRELLG